MKTVKSLTTKLLIISTALDTTSTGTSGVVAKKNPFNNLNHNSNCACTTCGPCGPNDIGGKFKLLKGSSFGTGKGGDHDHVNGDDHNLYCDYAPSDGSGDLEK